MDQHNPFGEEQFNKLRTELQELKEQFYSLVRRVYEIELKLKEDTSPLRTQSRIKEEHSLPSQEQTSFSQGQLKKAVDDSKVTITPGSAVSKEAQNIPPSLVHLTKDDSPHPKADLEINLGRFWLNKIGIVIFTLGIGMGMIHMYKFFGPLAKIIFGYVTSLCLFIFGKKFYKNEMTANFGFVLFAGAWAIGYFTTFAMYHFEATRIIQNQFVDLVFLCLVAGGMVVHALKLKSQTFVSLALFIAYVTATLGNINYFTFFSCAVLATVALVLVYKLQMNKILILGIGLTYLTHEFWVRYHVDPGRLNQVYFLTDKLQFTFDFVFLVVYWLLFGIGIHLIKEKREPKIYNQLAAANFGNFLLFFILATPRINILYPEGEFYLIFFLGLFYLLLGFLSQGKEVNKLSQSDQVIAISALTLALPIKLKPLQVDLIWLIEIPFLFYFGLRYNQMIYRFLGFAVTFLLLMRFIASYGPGGYHYSPGIIKEEFDRLLYLFKFFSMAGTYFLARRFCDQISMSYWERSGFKIFIALACLYGTIFIWISVPENLKTLILTLEALLLLILSFRIKEGTLRLFALVLFIITAYRFCFVDRYNFHPSLLRWSMMILQGCLNYMGYGVLRYMRLTYQGKEGWMEKFLWGLTIGGVIVTLHTYVPNVWITLSLGLSGVLFFMLGFLWKDKTTRLGGFILFAITILRVIFVEIAHLNMIYKVVSFIILGVLFLLISLIYNKIQMFKSNEKN